jgi:SAM-dependent methyltransferase
VGWWAERVVPHIVDRMCRAQPIGDRRDRALAGLEGEVLEIGFGSGLTLRHYPDAVSRVLAVEPSAVARRMAEPRIGRRGIPVEYAGLDGQSLALADASVDHAVSTFTLCTIPDASAALREVRRVLRPGGTLHFLEHGLSDEPNVVKWQHRCNGFQQRFAAGCHLDRPIDRLIRDAGYDVDMLTNEYLPGPGVSKPWSYLYLGVASPA